MLQEQVINVYAISDIIMMTSLKKKQKYFSDYELAFSLGGNDFVPPAHGRHLVMQKGFKMLMKKPMIFPLTEKSMTPLLASSVFKTDMAHSVESKNDFEMNIKRF